MCRTICMYRTLNNMHPQHHHLHSSCVKFLFQPLNKRFLFSLFYSNPKTLLFLKYHTLVVTNEKSLGQKKKVILDHSDNGCFIITPKLARVLGIFFYNSANFFPFHVYNTMRLWELHTLLST